MAFASAGWPLRCDFVIPSEHLIVEYDERQHFTLQRAKALELYPANIKLGFDRQEWISTCRTIRATDSDPPYRDEQRAFYDSLRDILAVRNGYRLVRFREGGIDWTSSDADEHLAAGLPDASETVASSTSDSIKKIALVSHNYNIADEQGLLDYSQHFARINTLCDEQGCDTILYALYTWDERSPVTKSHDAIFGKLAHIQRVIVEVGKPTESYDYVEVWLRNQKAPLLIRQVFAVSSASGTDKRRFIDGLVSRRIAQGLLVLCGETNITSLVRGSADFYDPFRFVDRLRELDVRLVLNPIHDYMRRYEMREKRRFYSLDSKIVVSVWNQGKGSESHNPWTVFHNGSEKTYAVRELSRPFNDRPDIRIGIVDVNTLEPSNKT